MGMDQTLLPGVGNVIKVEGLFAAGIHPLTPASSLTDPQWMALLNGVRDCAQHWYAALCGRGKLIKVCYGCKKCKRCGGRIALIREGALQRQTYFCQHCQPGSPPSRELAMSGPSGSS